MHGNLKTCIYAESRKYCARCTRQQPMPAANTEEREMDEETKKSRRRNSEYHRTIREIKC